MVSTRISAGCLIFPGVLLALAAVAALVSAPWQVAAWQIGAAAIFIGGGVSVFVACDARPLLLIWPVLIGLFLWSLRGESFGLLDGLVVFVAIFIYLATAFALAIAGYFETRRRRAGN